MAAHLKKKNHNQNWDATQGISFALVSFLFSLKTGLVFVVAVFIIIIMTWSFSLCSCFIYLFIY